MRTLEVTAKFQTETRGNSKRLARSDHIQTVPAPPAPPAQSAKGRIPYASCYHIVPHCYLHLLCLQRCTFATRVSESYGIIWVGNVSQLSGGEKQRVAIARAVLKDAPILLCDEATSSLDSKAEAGIMATMADLAHGRTTLFIAHRLSTIQDVDTIFVLEDGRVAESGTHDELLERNGPYASMWWRQAEKENDPTTAVGSDKL